MIARNFARCIFVQKLRRKRRDERQWLAFRRLWPIKNAADQRRPSDPRQLTSGTWICKRDVFCHNFPSKLPKDANKVPDEPYDQGETRQWPSSPIFSV
jgi:hypothetical protein